MATLRYKQKLAVCFKGTFVPGMTEEYITQVLEKIEGRVTKKRSQEISATESRFLGARPKIDEFLLNPQVWTGSRTVPGTSQNNDFANRKITFPE